MVSRLDANTPREEDEDVIPRAIPDSKERKGRYPLHTKTPEPRVALLFFPKSSEVSRSVV